MMKQGKARSEAPHSLRMPTSTMCWSSFLKICLWTWGIGYALWCTGSKPGSRLMWTFLCGYTQRDQSKSLLYLARIFSRWWYWFCFKHFWLEATLLMLTCSHLALRRLTAWFSRILHLNNSSSLSWHSWLLRSVECLAQRTREDLWEEYCGWTT